MKPVCLFSLVAFCGLVPPGALAQPCGTPWSAGTTGPAARMDHAMAYDSARGKVVVYGGRSAGQVFAETWEWTASGSGGGGTWELRAVTNPSTGYAAGLTFDSVRQRTVMFGGVRVTGSTTNATWEWDGIAWTPVQPTTSPPATDGRLLAFDSARARVVLVASQGSAPGTTWEYDGNTWALQADPTPVIYPTGSYSMAFDASRSRMVLVGPVVATGSLTGLGVWERNNATGWVLVNQGSFPYDYYIQPRCAYDPAGGRVLVLDGHDLFGSTRIWAWNGAQNSWSRLSGEGPQPLALGACAFDGAGGQLLMLGGYPPLSGPTSNRVDLYRPGMRSGPELSDFGARSLSLALNGPPAILRVAATGSGTISYQWRLNGIDLSNGGGFSGVTTPELTIDPNDGAHSGTYDAVVVDNCGSTIRPSTYVLISCYANCDGSSAMPVLNAEDFQCFLNLYAQGSTYANCDGSTATPLFTANDFQCFLNKYAAGCL